MGFIQDMVKEADGYAQPVGLTHNGKMHFKSVCGGFTTLLVLFMALGYGISLIVNPVDIFSKSSNISN